jgi:hypothetical protein
MKKIVVLSGLSNSGKTDTINRVISKIINNGAVLPIYKDEYTADCTQKFWEVRNRYQLFGKGGGVKLTLNNKTYGIVSFGDRVRDVENALTSSLIDNCQVIIFCTRDRNTGRNRIFEWTHEYIGQQQKAGASILPLHKNLVAWHGCDEKENERLADLILEIVL